MNENQHIAGAYIGFIENRNNIHGFARIIIDQDDGGKEIIAISTGTTNGTRKEMADAINTLSADEVKNLCYFMFAQNQTAIIHSDRIGVVQMLESEESMTSLTPTTEHEKEATILANTYVGIIFSKPVKPKQIPI